MMRAARMTKAARAGGMVLALLLGTGLAGAAHAQSTTTAPATTVTPASPATPAAPPAPASPSPSTAAPATVAPKPPASSGEDTSDKQPPDTSISQTLELPARPAVVLAGKATWDDGFKSITDAFAKLNDALAKNNITPTSHPLAVFTATDDAGFSFSAMIPLDKAPEGKTELTSEVRIGETPSGKAMRFQHRGAYDEIDSTYEAITAYLDEKGLEARNIFAEEYLNQVKVPDDSSLEVDIYVFLK